MSSSIEVPQVPVELADTHALSGSNSTAEDSPVKPVDTNKMNVPFSLNMPHEASWPASVAGVSFYTKEFSPKEGEGNGERRVAALFHPRLRGESDKNYTNRLGNFIAGQYDSYDVITDQGNFEVKEFKLTAKEGKYKGSVRVGAEGKHTTGMILSQVKEMLITMLQLYSSLDDDSKKVLNSQLIQTIQTKNEVPKNWNLENYIDAIFDVTMGDDKSITEFPKTLFNSDKILPKNFHRNAKRATFLVYTIPQILNGLKALAQKDEHQANLDNEITRVKNLQSTLKDIYLKNPDDSLGKEIDKEAELLDRKLIYKACASDRGSNCITINTFLQQLHRLNLPEVFANIDSLRQSEITNLFPPIVKGFFAAFETKYKYIPREKFGELLYIDSFTQKGLKIALRSANK